MIHVRGASEVLVNLVGQLPEAGEAEGSPGFFDSVYSFPAMLLLMFLVIYFLMIRPESKRQKARDAMLKALKKGDWVITTAGIVGRIQRLEEKEVILQVDKDSNVKMRLLRSAISEVRGEAREAETPATSEAS